MSVYSDCASHRRREEVPADGAHIICYECGHVYATAGALVDAYNAAVDAMRAKGFEPPPAHVRSADAVTFCQECLHDF